MPHPHDGEAFEMIVSGAGSGAEHGSESETKLPRSDDSEDSQSCALTTSESAKQQLFEVLRPEPSGACLDRRISNRDHWHDKFASDSQSESLGEYFHALPGFVDSAVSRSLCSLPIPKPSSRPRTVDAAVPSMPGSRPGATGQALTDRRPGLFGPSDQDFSGERRSRSADNRWRPIDLSDAIAKLPSDLHLPPSPLRSSGSCVLPPHFRSRSSSRSRQQEPDRWSGSGSGESIGRLRSRGSANNSLPIPRGRSTYAADNQWSPIDLTEAIAKLPEDLHPLPSPLRSTRSSRSSSSCAQTSPRASRMHHALQLPPHMMPLFARLSTPEDMPKLVDMSDSERRQTLAHSAR